MKLKTNFSIVGVMATSTVDSLHSCRRPAGHPRAMTRCECADVSFAEMAARIDEGEHLDEAARATGCGQTCTACWPDLERFLLANRQ